METSVTENRLTGLETDGEVTIDLMELFGLFLSRIRLIIIALVMGALITGLVTAFLITPKYTASTKIYMVSASNGSAVDLSDLNIGTSLSQDYEEMINIRPIYEDVIADLKLPYTVDQLRGMVSISNVTNTRVIRLDVVSPDPKEACNIANDMADKALEYLPELMETSPPHVAETAIVPKAPSSPNLFRNTIIGALVGMLAALAYLTLLYVQDDTITSSDEMERIFGIVPLTVIQEGDIQEISDEKEKELRDAAKKRRRKKKR